MKLDARMIRRALTIIAAVGTLSAWALKWWNGEPVNWTEITLTLGVLGAALGFQYNPGDPPNEVIGMPVNKKFVFALLMLPIALGGCAVGAVAPGYVKCKGKGVITGSGAGNAAALYGVGGMNAFTLSVDCGDGLEFEQGKGIVPSATIELPPRPEK